MIEGSAQRGTLRPWWGPGLLSLTLALTAQALPAQAQTGTPAPSQPSTAEAASQTAAVTAQPSEAPAEAIVVTGSRIARSSGFTAPTPVTTLDAERFEALAQTNIAEGLNQLPSFRASSGPANQQTAGGPVGARVLDLRALGPARTLVLVDGRRFVPSTVQGTVDINLIPSALVERTEVVTGGASAVYGSDAVAGVVNFILDRDYEGLEAEAEAGISQRGDDATQFLSFAGGTRLGERFHIVGGIEYENNKGLAGCYQARSWCAQERQIVGRPAGRTDIPASTITSDVHTSTLYPGGVINASQVRNAQGALVNLAAAADPLRGTKFLPDGTPAPFIYGDLAGPLFMIGGDGHGRNSFLTGLLLKVPVERISTYLSGTFELSDSIEVFADLSYGRVEGTTFSSTFRDFNASLTGPIRRGNPFIPASIATGMAARGIEQFTLGKAGLEFGSPRSDSKTETYRAVAGLEGEIADNWNWEVYYQYGRTDFRADITNNPVLARLRNAVDAVRSPGGSIVCAINADASTANDDPACRPLNLFGEGRTPEAYSYVLGSGFQTTHNEQHVVAGSIGGDLAELWAGPISVAAGAEWRRNTIEGETDPISANNGFWVLNGQLVNGKQSVKEAYVETVVPLARDVPFARTLELNGAFRYTDYSTSGSVETWKVGGVWEPVEQLRFRATRSRDIRAPNLSELRGPITRTTIGLTDPRTGLQTNPTVFRGSNPDLDVEKADSWTAGVIIRPTWGFLERARLSVDYYNIKVKDAIDVVGAQTLVQRCEAGATEFCPLIDRDPVTQTVLVVRDVLFNASAVKTSGFDIEFDYRQPLGDAGDLSLRVLATIVKDLITTDSAGSTERAGQTGSRAGALLGVPDYTINGLLTWTRGPGSVTAQARYIPSGIFNVAFIGPDDPNYSIASPTSVNDNTVPDRFYLDLAGQYTITTASGMEFELFGAINNVLDRDPPAMPSGNLGTNQVLFDPIGRAFRLGVRVRMGG